MKGILSPRQKTKSIFLNNNQNSGYESLSKNTFDYGGDSSIAGNEPDVPKTLDPKATGIFSCLDSYRNDDRMEGGLSEEVDLKVLEQMPKVIDKLIFNNLQELENAMSSHFLKIKQELIEQARIVKNAVVKVSAAEKSLRKETDAWELEKRLIKERTRVDSEILKINVGGQLRLTTSRDMLCQFPNSLLQKTFNNVHKLKYIVNPNTNDREIFLDRDPQTFQFLITYLRGNCSFYPKFASSNEELCFVKELAYWGIPDSLEEEQKLLEKLPDELVTALKEDPEGLKPIPLEKWRELGPIKIFDLLKQSTDSNPIVFDRAVGKSDKNFSFNLFGQVLTSSKKMQ